MPWLRRWRRKHGRTKTTVNAPSFGELLDRQNGHKVPPLSTGDPRLLRTERPGDRIEDAIVGGHTS